MKSSQVAVGASYEDKDMTVVRTVTRIFRRKGEMDTVQYSERDANTGKSTYSSARMLEMSRTEFAAWAARPAGTKLFLSKGKFRNWLAGPTDKKR